ncbi:hypothetical protein FRC08_013560 [Ceratobasidium sp. 394]|nr:hypothetical protein FRC08_013560 [Ceratobasidium sp. 394]
MARQATLTTYVTQRRHCSPEAVGSENNETDNGDECGSPTHAADTGAAAPHTSALVDQVSRSLRQINQSEGARFEHLFGALAELSRSTNEVIQAMHDLSATVGDLAQAQAETNLILRAMLVPTRHPAPVVPGPPFPPPPLQTPGAGPSCKELGRSRMSSYHR